MKLTPEQRRDLMRRIVLMAEAHNRVLSDDLVAFWVEELAPHYGSILFDSMHATMREKWMPSVKEVLEPVRQHDLQQRRALAEQRYQRDLAAYAGVPKRLTAAEEQAATEDAAEFFRRLNEKLGLPRDEPTEPH